MVKIFAKPKLQLLLIIILTFLAYSNIFQNNFSTDDIEHVFNWKTNKEIRNIPKIFFEESVPPDERGAYRPVRALFLMGVYLVWKYNVFGYHAFSLAIYILSIILIYLITQEIIKKKAISYFTTLLFALHPIHTEAVTYIIASFDSAGFMFYLMSFWLYVSARKSTSKEPRSLPRHLRGDPKGLLEGGPLLSMSTLLYLGSLISAILAVLTYELAFSLPLVIVLYEIVFNSSKSPPRRSTFGHLRGAVWTLPFFILFLSVAILRLFILHIPQKGVYLDGSFYISILAMIKAFVYYIILLIYPVNLSINHQIFEGVYSVISKDYINTETLKTLSLFRIDIFSSLILLIGLVFTAIKMFRRIPIVSFAILWFFLTLLPVSYLLPQTSILGERYAFLASYGYCLLLAYLVYNLLGRHSGKPRQTRRIQNLSGQGITAVRDSGVLASLVPRMTVLKCTTVVVFVLVLVGFGLRTYLRNQDWKDTLTVWQVLASQGPEYPLNNLNLARIYEEQKKYDQSLTYYKKLVSVESLKSEVYYKIGLIYQRQGKLDSAKKSYESSAKLGSSFALLSKMQLDKINKFGKTLTDNTKKSNSLLEYVIEREVRFSYPGDWFIQSKTHGVILFSPLEPFYLEINVITKNKSQTIENYIKAQNESYGNLINQGEALIPNMDKSYVKIFDDKGIKKMLFYLFKKDLVIEVLVYPSDSALMKEFDKILGSIRV